MEEKMNSQNEFSKGFLAGALIGGVAGAITALLLAPKSGQELRKDIAETSSQYYGAASDYFKQVEAQVEDAVMKSVNDGKVKAQGIIDSARNQAKEILSGAEAVLSQAKVKANEAKESVAHNYDAVRDAAKAGADAFKAEMKASKEQLGQ